MLLVVKVLDATPLVQVVGSQEMLRSIRPAGSQPEYVCPRSTGLLRPTDRRHSNMISVDDTTLDVEPIVCYLADILSAAGDCDSAIASRCCSSWCNFRKLPPIETYRLISFGKRAKVYTNKMNVQ